MESSKNCAPHKFKTFWNDIILRFKATIWEAFLMKGLYFCLILIPLEKVEIFNRYAEIGTNNNFANTDFCTNQRPLFFLILKPLEFFFTS